MRDMSHLLSSRIIASIALLTLGSLLVWAAQSSTARAPLSAMQTSAARLARPRAPHPTPVVKSIAIEPPPKPMTVAPAQTFSAGGHGVLQQREIESAAIVGNMSPTQPLPDELSDCHWADSDEPRIVCSVQVFLPPAYFDDGGRYPVVYLLHGWGGWDVHITNTEWNLYGTYQIADALMRSGELPPFNSVERAVRRALRAQLSHELLGRRRLTPARPSRGGLGHSSISKPS